MTTLPPEALSKDDDDLVFALPDGLKDRCERIYNWDDDFANRAILGYRQFMKLKSKVEDWEATELAPSPIIRQVWQQHIWHVQHYVKACQDYCGHLVWCNPDDELDAQACSGRVKTTKVALKLEFGKDCIDPEIWSFEDYSTKNNNVSPERHKENPQQQQQQQQHQDNVQEGQPDNSEGDQKNEGEDEETEENDNLDTKHGQGQHLAAEHDKNSNNNKRKRESKNAEIDSPETRKKNLRRIQRAALTVPPLVLTLRHDLQTDGTRADTKRLEKITVYHHEMAVNFQEFFAERYNMPFEYIILQYKADDGAPRRMSSNGLYNARPEHLGINESKIIDIDIDLPEAICFNFLYAHEKESLRLKVKMKLFTCMQQAFEGFAKRVEATAENLRFFYNGREIQPLDTPFDLMLTDEEIITVVRKRERNL